MTFELTDACDEDEFIGSQLEALGGIADLMRSQVSPGGIGAYLFDAAEQEEDVKYYLVKWIGHPYQSTTDEEINI